MSKLFGLFISCLIFGISVGLPTKDIDELIYRLEELKQQNHYDEQFDRLNLARPSALNGNNNRDNHGGSNNIDGMEENEFIPRYSDYYNRKMTLASFNQLPVSIFHRPLASNNFHLSNFGDDLNRKRFYFEPKQINFNPNEPHQMSNQQQSTLPIKEQQAQSYAQSSAINANQHPLKRAIDSIGGANLLKRAVDRIGGGHLLKRR